MDYLLDDLIDYTMEKIAAEEEVSEEERYNQELAKAKKRKLIGAGLMGGGIAGALAVQNHGEKEFNELQKKRYLEAVERQNAHANDLFYFDARTGFNQAMDEMNHNEKMQKRGLLPSAAFWAGAGTLGYNHAKKKQARLRYENYLNSSK